jgi:hypothetical protein
MGIVFTLGAFAYWGLGSFGYTPYMFILLARLIFFTWGEIFSLFPAIATDAYGAKQMLACSTPRRAPPSGSCLGQRHQELQQQLALGLRHRRDHEPEGRHAGAFHCWHISIPFAPESPPSLSPPSLEPSRRSLIFYVVGMGRYQRIIWINNKTIGSIP